MTEQPHEGVVRALTGSLPCISCGYDLRGLTVKGVCPECSTAVRATVLARVDPGADALKPITHKRLLAFGIRLCFSAALVAIAAGWAMKAQEIWPMLTTSTSRPPSAAGTPWGVLQLIALCACCIGSMSISLPVPGVPRSRSWIALAGSILCIPGGIYAIHRIQSIDVQPDGPLAAAYIARDPDPARLVWHIIATAAFAVAIMLIRPAVRPLVVRCRAIRVGRVDRQHLIVLVILFVIIIAGSLIRAAWFNGGVFEILDPIGAVVIFVASILLSITLTRAMIDSWRIAYAIDHPPLGLKDIMADSRTAPPVRPASSADTQTDPDTG